MASVPWFGTHKKKKTVRFNDNVTSHLHDKVPTDDTAAVWWTRRWNAVTCGPSGTNERIEAARASALMPAKSPEASVSIPPVPLPGLVGDATFSFSYIKDLIQRSLMPSYKPEASVPTPPIPHVGRDGCDSVFVSHIKDVLRRGLEARDPVPPSGRESYGSSFSLSSIKEVFQRAFERTLPFEGRVVHPPAPAPSPCPAVRV
jgi:hypothetical protein